VLAVPDPRSLPDADLETLLRERAYRRDCELQVERTEHGWLAGFKQYRDPADLAPRGFVGLGAEARSRREALQALLDLDG